MNKLIKYEDFPYEENYEINPDFKKRILKYIKHGPILDVGCGNGSLLTIFKDNFEIEGFDPSERAIIEAKKRFGLILKKSTIQEFFPKRKYKVIFVIGIINHVENPVENLKKVASWLDKDGVLIMTVQNSFSPFSKRTERNIFYPSYWRFNSFLKKCGLKIIKVEGSGKKLKKFPVISPSNLYILERN